ncbi:MAG: DEAD/DEAH box helicase [Desulfobulbaceae bacterium]|nr:DEAD/DEAH box helicase [Desulfobulbaceae bacterium]
MVTLQIDTIRKIADSPLIFKRGEFLQKNGAFSRIHDQSGEGRYVYEVDGNYGNYRTEVVLNGAVSCQCDCPYPGPGCKHIVAILLELFDQQGDMDESPITAEDPQAHYLSYEEIRQQAFEDRHKRAKSEEFKVVQGDMLKGDHLVTTVKGRQYQLTLHNPAAGVGHCSCPDFFSNKLAVCKHLIFLSSFLQGQKGFADRLGQEVFPYIDIFWDSAAGKPRLFHERSRADNGQELADLLSEIFDEQQLFRKENVADFIPYLSKLAHYKQVRVQEPVIHKLTNVATAQELSRAAAKPLSDISRYLKVVPYAYQEEGIKFGLYKKGVLIGDEMGLGKTLQAIGLSIFKKDIFGFRTVLVVTMSSLKQQWQREIERFSDEKACIIAGSAQQRKEQYRTDTSLFKITNYEAVLRDVTIISRLKPDVIILDEAQRIKNFETKTAEAVKSLPRQHAIILTGTPLENKLEDVYSLVQFLDPELLSPLWQFAADHFLLGRRKKGDILGYVNLNRLHEKLKPLVIRRRKEEVLDELPEMIVNDYYIDLHQEQAEIHAGYSQSLLPLLNKKFLTPMDLRRIMTLLLKMRQTCDSTYLIDRETNISPKLDELANILEELIKQNGRKVVIFSEWTTMTMLIGKHLSREQIPFVELSGKVPVVKRQALIDEFNTNPDCKVFLSTDAGGTGLNLQAADCVVNFELPWNPAKVNQRIGRVNRIGQKSKCINVINLIAKYSIEERIMAGIKLKGELFDGVFDGGQDEVMLSREKRQEMVNQLREMMGEETEMVLAEPRPKEELAEDTPHFLNPEVLKNEVDFIAEEQVEPLEEQLPQKEERDETVAEPAEKMEEVLNQGMGFISGLLEMATGKQLGVAEGGEKMVTLDKETGEVTLKFTLPGFSKD